MNFTHRTGHYELLFVEEHEVGSLVAYSYYVVGSSRQEPNQGNTGVN